MCPGEHLFLAEDAGCLAQSLYWVKVFGFLSAWDFAVDLFWKPGALRQGDVFLDNFWL